MLLIDNPQSFDLRLIDNNISHVILPDHLGGFDQSMTCSVLETVNQLAKGRKITVDTEYIFDQSVRGQYPNLNLKFSAKLHNKLLSKLLGYNQHPVNQFENFLCSFNGSPHVSRKLLASILYKFGWFDLNYCSKNFSYSADVLDGHIADYVGYSNNFYRKFFISDECENFFQTINSFGHVRFDHAQNIYNLERQLTRSFLHIVSETMATSFYPFYGEKFLYSIVTRGLFLAYAQPGWHAHVEKYYGFQKYTRLFDYRFDSIQNPVERLVEIMVMISKFSILSKDDWQDLYEMESDTIEFNYNHYRSGDYLKYLKTYE